MSEELDLAMQPRLLPIVRVERFLGEATVEQLLEYAIAHEADFQPSKLRRDGERVVDASVRVSKKLRDLGPFKAVIETAVSNAMAETSAQMKIDYLQSYSLETELVWHGDGAFFKPHIDTFAYENRPASRRALSVVYYFHRKPKAFSGGQLRLYPLGAQAEGGDYQDIEPESDSVVLFPSWVRHEVLPILCDSTDFADGRFAINCWVHKITNQDGITSTPPEK